MSTNTITTEQAKKIMKLRNWSETMIASVLVTRMDGEFKFSPNPTNLDAGCYWMDREEVKELATA
jgi:hypothetical protein